MNRKAIRLWEQQDHEGALREFRNTAVKSKDVVAWIDYGNALILSWQGLRAVAAFETARRIGPARAVDRGAADRLLGMRRYDLALPFLERVRAAGDGEPRHAAGLVTALDRASRLEEAQAALKEAISRFGPTPEWRLIEAKLLQRRRIYDEALAVLDQIAAGGVEITNAQMSAVHYERAACLEKLGRFSEVFPTLQLAKAPLLKDHQPILEKSWWSLEILDAQLRELTRDQVRAWRESQPARPHPLGLIGGFPRSGTTLLEAMLSSHERVAISSEAAIFSDFIVNPACDPQDGSFPTTFLRTHVHRLASRYWHFQEGNTGSLDGRLLLDKNPAITPLLHHFVRFFPDARLLICLRDPRDVLLSCYMQQLPLNNVSVHFLDWQETWRLYQKCMEMWLRFRDLLDDGFLEVRYERLVTDPEGEVRKVLALLDLPWSEQLSDYRDHVEERGVYSPTYADVKEPIHKGAMNRWTCHADQFGSPEGVPENNPLFQMLGY